MLFGKIGVYEGDPPAFHVVDRRPDERPAYALPSPFGMRDDVDEEAVADAACDCGEPADEGSGVVVSRDGRVAALEGERVILFIAIPADGLAQIANRPGRRSVADANLEALVDCEPSFTSKN